MADDVGCSLEMSRFFISVVAIYAVRSVCDDCLWRFYSDLGRINPTRKNLHGSLQIERLFMLSLIHT